MKMVKSLLLGSAAGLVAVAGAQAADLPVKAKPVQYVKICSLYGAGFFYIPGSDTCLKIGGYVRTEGGYGNGLGSVTTGGLVGATDTRLSNDFIWRARGYATFDAREQTAYGTVRGYMAIGFNADNTTAPADTQSAAVNNYSTSFATGLSVNRAFVQFAGFTMGIAPSFFDFYSSASVGFFGAYPNSDSGDGGKRVFVYTAQFGNGFSGTIGVEESQRTQTWVLNPGATLSATGTLGASGFAPAESGYGGFHWPDVVGNLRVDQAWGSAQVSGVLHEVDPSYYSAAGTGLSSGAASGHPGDKVGYAISAGLKINVPQAGPGDWFQTQFIYTKGASLYQFRSIGNGGNFLRWNGGNFAYGAMTDGVTNAYAAGAGLDLTTTYGFAASYEHFWRKDLHTTLYGGWAKVQYSDAASATICTGLTATVMTFAAATPCGSQNWSTWSIGSRTQWDITRWFYVGVDVLYSKLQTANNGATVTTLGANGAQPANTYNINNQDVWGMRWRVHRDFGF
jgi:hypothetical protein